MATNDIPPVKDDAPALAPVGREFGGEADGVNPATMPEFTPISRLMPSARVDLKATLAEIAEYMPTSEADVVAGGRINAQNMRRMAEGYKRIEQQVLTLAKDPTEFSEWLLSQDDPEAALIVAFNHLVNLLKN